MKGDEVLCAVHGWEPEDADCDVAATAVRTVEWCAAGHPPRPAGEQCGPCADDALAWRAGG